MRNIAGIAVTARTHAKHGHHGQSPKRATPPGTQYQPSQGEVRHDKHGKQRLEVGGQGGGLAAQASSLEAGATASICHA